MSLKEGMAKVDVSTEDEPRNRVSLFIDIDEGEKR